ncbi:hypothetical protein K0H71_02275 [Bacillus sp. IITD106]|nr:hypothetical protein [Bacillus sp. IITD106]
MVVERSFSEDDLINWTELISIFIISPIKQEYWTNRPTSLGDLSNK